MPARTPTRVTNNCRGNYDSIVPIGIFFRWQGFTLHTAKNAAHRSNEQDQCKLMWRPAQAYLSLTQTHLSPDDRSPP